MDEGVFEGAYVSASNHTGCAVGNVPCGFVSGTEVGRFDGYNEGGAVGGVTGWTVVSRRVGCAVVGTIASMVGIYVVGDKVVVGALEGIMEGAIKGSLEGMADGKA